MTRADLPDLTRPHVETGVEAARDERQRCEALLAERQADFDAGRCDYGAAPARA